MLIPSIDLMGGKIVQLVQGERKALEFDDFDYWIGRFSKYPLVQVIDLDAARGTGNNRAIVAQIVQRLQCQVGGGIRTAETARELLETGARRVIFGSALLKDGKINTKCAAKLATSLGTAALVFALDSRGGRVAIEGWRKETAVSAFDMIRALEPFCETFLYTHIDTEGLMAGIPMPCCGGNPASYFPATGGRRWYPDATRDRQPGCAGDGLRCRNGLVFRPDLSLNMTQPAASTVNTQRKAARTGLPAEQPKAGLVRIEPGSTLLQLLPGPRGVTTGLAFQFLVFDVALQQAAADSVALAAIE